MEVGFLLQSHPASMVSTTEEAAAGAGNQSDFTLHIFPFSLYSIMTRLTYAFGHRGSGKLELDMQLALVNLHRNENLSADYLLTVNSKGQVRNPSLSQPD